MLAPLFDRLRAFRDRVAADPAVQRRALKNPVLRVFARRRARAMLDLTAGFVYSQVLFACVKLRLFEQLRTRPQTTEEIAAALALAPDAARRLLEAAVSLDLADRRSGGRYGLGDLGAALLGNPAALALVEHQPMLYADLADPVGLLRGDRRASLADWWPYSDTADPCALADDDVGPYSALMAASQPMVAEEALGAYPFARHRRLLDIGGGEGAFLCAAGQKIPALELSLFDLPAVVERARTRIGAAGLAGRTQFSGGNFLSDALPGGADVATLIRIVHDHDDASALALLRNVRRALAPGATLVIVEAMSGVAGARPLDAYYGFYTLAMGRGQPRTAADISALLLQAGFSSGKLWPNALPSLASILSAEAV